MAAVGLPPDTWQALPCQAQALILALQVQVVARQIEAAALQAPRSLHRLGSPRR